MTSLNILAIDILIQILHTKGVLVQQVRLFCILIYMKEYYPKINC